MVDERYKLPINSAEMDRLDVQHRLWSLLIGGLYPPTLNTRVNELLSAGGATKSILDVGCGSGIWAIEMARRFSHAEVVGFDLNPQRYKDAPTNFSFIHGDLMGGLPIELHEKFDVVHCRCVAQHVPDPHALMRILARCLKPDGLLLLADGDWVAFDSQKRLLDPVKWNPDITIDEQVENDLGHSWYAGWLHLFGAITRSPNYEPIDVLLKVDGLFKDVTYKKYYTPVNWSGEGLEHGEEVGRIMDRNMREFFEGGAAVVLAKGMPPATLEVWRKGLMKEMNQHHYNVWHWAYAVKSLYIQ
ncbi:S-adenosyl-L-methionine-dependent methyltransferase [Crucibulum laeve]|uniref:S-adenosyl-L-methionine-dependent methyltransferase n=1 Tax=Crucibulum laeve TaxID=68775 RepID=A0A5C3M327_9AGAR|nr:S-adenosyl-L-methionine-dependent methyltransferase [Crucibulum laeve]